MRAWVALLLLWPALASADFKSDYRDGIAAAERQDWARVELLMRKAMAQEPNPQARVRLYGQVFVPYVPKFYLGLAAFSRNDCPSAVALFEDASHAGVIRGQREEQRQQIMLRSCRAKLALAAAPSDAATGSPPAAATPAPAQPSPKPPAPSVAVATPAAPGARFDSAKVQSLQSRLDRVDANLATAAKTLNDPLLATVRSNWQRQLAPLQTQATSLRQRLRSLTQSRDAAALVSLDRAVLALEPGAIQLLSATADALARSRGTALADARTRLEQTLAQWQPMLAAAPTSTEAKALSQALQLGRRDLASSELAPVQAAIAAIESAGRAFDAAQARSALSGQVRARLKPLVEDYLLGNFAKLDSWSDEQTLRAVPQAQAQALLLRAAARLELFVLGGERDLVLMEKIREDMRAARRLAGAVLLSKQAFSPRFRALFASTR